MKESKKKELVSEQPYLCDGMNFTMAEAYKMLRTKLNLTVPQESESSKCKIIGVTSALRGEGKTLTSINLAYTFAESKEKVCLIEADMRLPNIAKRLEGLRENPGLSNLLTEQERGSRVIQKYESPKGVQFDVVAAGDIPPMPSELLTSRNMQTTLNALSRLYKYIIVDLPPVTVVTDAIAISPMLTGILLVIRRNYCDTVALRDTVDQMHVSGVRMLGCVFNGADSPGGTSRYYSRSRRYGSGYYYKNSGAGRTKKRKSSREEASGSGQ